MAVTYTYDDNARREDLMDVITNLDFKEFQLMSGLGTSEAKDILHQWLTDTLKTPGQNNYVEGVDASYPDRSDPTRLFNYCQIVRIGYDVSDTERAVVQAGFNDRYQYEMGKALKEWKQDAEYALMRSSLACASGSASRQMEGIKRMLVSNNYTSQSGVSLTETMLNDYFQNVDTDGTQVNALYMDMYLKRKISAFTAGSTKNFDAADRRLILAVDVYQADAASNVKLFRHRFVTVTGDTNHDLVGINEDFFKIAYLRKPMDRELAKTGDSTKGEIVGELTLECLHKDAGFFTAALK